MAQDQMCRDRSIGLIRLGGAIEFGTSVPISDADDHLTLSGALDVLPGLRPVLPVETWIYGTNGDSA